jgi:hypothetical protein
MISATAGNILTGLLGEFRLRARSSVESYTNGDFSSHSLGRCTCTASISIEHLYRAIYHIYHSNVKEPATQSRDYSMLPRSVLGRR